MWNYQNERMFMDQIKAQQEKAAAAKKAAEAGEA